MVNSVALRQGISKLLHLSPNDIIPTKLHIHMNSTSIDTFHAVKLTESLNKPQEYILQYWIRISTLTTLVYLTRKFTNFFVPETDKRSARQRTCKPGKITARREWIRLYIANERQHNLLETARSRKWKGKNGCKQRGESTGKVDTSTVKNMNFFLKRCFLTSRKMSVALLMSKLKQTEGYLQRKLRIDVLGNAFLFRTSTRGFLYVLSPSYFPMS
jgi:hypothetical protein